MIGSTMSGEKPSRRTFRFFGRLFEIFVMVSVAAGLLLLSYDNPWFVLGGVFCALAFTFGAYYCAVRSRPEKSAASEAEKPFGVDDRYVINQTNLEKMTGHGVPWDVVGALTRLINEPSSSDKNLTGMSEVEIIERLVSLKCDLGRINEFRRQILKNTRVDKTIDRSTASN